jgi:hypothetical protein
MLMFTNLALHLLLVATTTWNFFSIEVKEEEEEKTHMSSLNTHRVFIYVFYFLISHIYLHFSPFLLSLSLSRSLEILHSLSFFILRRWRKMWTREWEKEKRLIEKLFMYTMKRDRRWVSICVLIVLHSW